MKKQGSNSRRKTQSVLVRVSEAEYSRLSALASAEGTTRAEYLRRRIGQHVEASGGHSEHGGLIETERMLLSNCHRSMGHLAGMMKYTTCKLPPLGMAGRVQAMLDEHHGELQQLQSGLRKLLERLP